MNSLGFYKIVLYVLIGAVIIGILLFILYFTYLKLTIKNKSYRELIKIIFETKKAFISTYIICIFTYIAVFFDTSTSLRINPDFLQTKQNILVRGKIAYDISDKMKVGSQYSGIVSISKSINDRILFFGLDSSNFQKEEINVSSIVEVSLIDPTDNKNFELIALNTKEQLVNDTTNTIWEWNIIPLRRGIHDLIIRATVRVLTELGVTTKDIPVFTKRILVRISPIFSITQFIRNYWQWLLGTLLIPFSIWIYQKKNKSKSSGKTKIGFKLNK